MADACPKCGTPGGKGFTHVCMFAGLPDPTAVCPICHRTVGVFRHPDLGVVLLGHRTTMPHTPETPWCSGGGRQQIDAALEVLPFEKLPIRPELSVDQSRRHTMRPEYSPHFAFAVGAVLMAEEMRESIEAIFDGPPPRGPLTCDMCGRFVSVKDAVISHEFGDYGAVYSTEVECPRCAEAHNA